MEKALMLGFVFGFTTASPIEPVGLLCLHRVVSKGILSGLLSALGISCAYAFWTYAAVHGLSSISYWIEKEILLLEIAIGLFFLLYRLHGLFNTPNSDYPILEQKKGIAEFISTFLVVLLNPTTFIMFSALLALFGIAKKHYDLIESLEISSSVFVGAISFWVVITQIIQKT